MFGEKSEEGATDPTTINPVHHVPPSLLLAGLEKKKEGSCYANIE